MGRGIGETQVTSKDCVHIAHPSHFKMVDDCCSRGGPPFSLASFSTRSARNWPREFSWCPFGATRILVEIKYNIRWVFDMLCWNHELLAPRDFSWFPCGTTRILVEMPVVWREFSWPCFGCSLGWILNYTRIARFHLWFSRFPHLSIPFPQVTRGCQPLSSPTPLLTIPDPALKFDFMDRTLEPKIKVDEIINPSEL